MRGRKKTGATEPFRVLCADPPWRFGDALGRRGAEANYPTLSIEEIHRFPLPPLADDAVLFLWRVAAMQLEALTVIRAWGFTAKSEIVWRKLTKNGKPHFGMGRYVRATHETCIIAVRGKPQLKSRSIRSMFEAPIGQHSEKPESFYTGIVEQLYDGPYVELFARRQRAGWTCLGNQANGERLCRRSS